MENRIKDIITDVETLSSWSVEIDTRKESKLMQEIILALKETMRANNLVSLAAPQIGYNKRILCLRFGEKDYRTFINPMIENNTSLTMSREKCSSIPDKEFVIPRFAKIKFYFTTPMGKVEACSLAGMAASRYRSGWQSAPPPADFFKLPQFNPLPADAAMGSPNPRRLPAASS